MREEITVAVPHEYHKNNQRVYEIAKNVDVIVEVVDARIAYSGSNLLDYSEPRLKDKQRMIVLTHVDVSDREQTEEWVKYFRNEGLICELLQSDDILSDEQLNNFWLTAEDSFALLKGKKAAIIGLPSSGKTTFVKRFYEHASLVENTATLQLEISDLNEQNYLPDAEIIDTPSTTGVHFTELQNYWHIQMIGAIKIPANQEILSVKLFKLLLKKYRSKLEAAYSLKLPTTLKVEDILNEFIKIWNQQGNTPSDDTIDLQLISQQFIKDIQSGTKINNFSLEWVTDYLK